VATRVAGHIPFCRWLAEATKLQQNAAKTYSGSADLRGSLSWTFLYTHALIHESWTITQI
jgi:hypothetical protein